MTDKSTIKKNLMNLHNDLVKNGEYDKAINVLHLLHRHKLIVGLMSDVGFWVETKAEEIGCRVSYSRNYNIATVTY